MKENDRKLTEIIGMRIRGIHEIFEIQEMQEIQGNSRKFKEIHRKFKSIQ